MTSLVALAAFTLESMRSLWLSTKLLFGNWFAGCPAESAANTCALAPCGAGLIVADAESV